MPAVLQRPHPLASEAARPDHQRREPAGTDRDRLVAEHLTGRSVDRRDRMRALVGVRPEHDHDLVHVLFPLRILDARRTGLAWGAATLLICAGNPRQAPGPR